MHVVPYYLICRIQVIYSYFIGSIGRLSANYYRVGKHICQEVCLDISLMW